MPADYELRLAVCYYLLLTHISYYAPILGFILRNFVIGNVPRSEPTEDGTMLISEFDYLSHAT